MAESLINNERVSQTLNKSYKLVKRFAAWLLSLALYPIYIFIWCKHFTSQTQKSDLVLIALFSKCSNCQLYLEKGNANLNTYNQRTRNHNESGVDDWHCRGSKCLQHLVFALSRLIRQLWWKTACSKVSIVSFQQKIFNKNFQKQTFQNLNHNLTV